MVSSYTDPGTYIRERIVPGASTAVSDRVLCLVGIAPRSRRITDEAIIRGKIYAESLTLSSSPPYEATLTKTSNRDRNNATLYRNDQALGLGDWGFNPCKMTGGRVVGAAVDTTLAHYFTLSMDGKAPVTLELTTKGAGTPLTTIRTELNAALAAVSAYGAAYNAVFTTITGAVANDTLVITSPISTSASDIKIFLSFETVGVHLDCANEVSLAVWNPSSTTGVQGASVVYVQPAVYSSSDTYTIDYVTVDNLTDELEFADSTNPLIDLVSVGSFPGGSSYVEDVDFEDTSNKVDWAVVGQEQAKVTTLAAASWVALAVGVNDEVRLSINGLGPWTIQLTTGVPGVPTPANVALDINTYLDTNVGPEYAYCAVVSGTTVVISAPDQFENYPVAKGTASVVALYDSTATAIASLFGIAAGSLPLEDVGIGSRPYFGTTYYCTYDYTRPSTDYDTPVRVYSPDDMYTYTSPITMSNYTRNKLAIWGEIAFENGCESIVLVQINDSTAPGTPTQTQINTAIDGAGESTVTTDVVALDTSEATHVKLMNHVASMCSQTEKKYRRGWYGMARGTTVGDPDTPDTLVYRSTRTLQPGATSTGRGRQILCSPCSISRVVTLDDGREVTLEMDGTALAVADAAKFVSLPKPSDALLGKFVTGFLTDSTFETYLQAERHVLAGNGVCVNTLEAGNIVLLDPLTTEAGGGRVIQFEEPSSSAQKDSVTRAIQSILDSNCRGVVPDDLSDFITDVKSWIAIAIRAQIGAGNIAAYRNSNGTARDVNLLTDIKCVQDPSDPRSFLFKYWFNLKYVAKILWGIFGR